MIVFLLCLETGNKGVELVQYWMCTIIADICVSSSCWASRMELQKPCSLKHMESKDITLEILSFKIIHLEQLGCLESYQNYKIKTNQPKPGTYQPPGIFKQSCLNLRANQSSSLFLIEFFKIFCACLEFYIYKIFAGFVQRGCSFECRSPLPGKFNKVNFLF